MPTFEFQPAFQPNIAGRRCKVVRPAEGSRFKGKVLGLKLKGLGFRFEGFGFGRDRFNFRPRPL